MAASASKSPLSAGQGCAELRFVEQQLHLGLLRQLAQRACQWLGGQVDGHRRGMGAQAHGQAQGKQGRTGGQVVQRTQRGQHEFPQTAKGRKNLPSWGRRGGRRGVEKNLTCE
jgi:hypothetical protein